MTERRLEFVEGKSSKFWNATHEGTDVTVVYGRIGTNGQTQVKTFASEAEAKKAYDKQVAEKVKKGYTDATGCAPSASAAEGSAAKAPAAEAKAKAKPPRTATASAASDSVSATDSGSDSASDSNSDSASAPNASGVEPRIHLSQADRIAGLVEPIPITPRVAVLPFDREQCIERLAKLGKADQWAYSLRWERLGLTPAMTREEAWFWVRVGREGSQLGALLTTAKTVATSPAELENRWQQTPGGLIGPEYVALGVEAFCDRLFSNNAGERQAMAVVEHLIPQLDAAERATLRDVVLTHANKTPRALATWLLGALGLTGDVFATQLANQASLPAGFSQQAQHYMYSGDATAQLRSTFGLRDPAGVLAALQRTEMLPLNAADARALLAAAGFPACELIGRGVLAMNTKADAESLANALALAEGPATVLPMFTVFLESKVPGVARQWLDAHPHFSVPELLPLVATQGAKADAAASYLREAVRAGHDALVEAALADLPENVERAVRAKVLDAREDQHAVGEDSELPEWATRCFGDPAKLVIAPAELSAELHDPPLRVNVAAAGARSAVDALPAYVPPGASPPFDFEACLARALACHLVQGSPPYAYDYWDWQRVTIALPMSPEEGRFWVFAQGRTGHRVTQADAEKKLRAERFDQPLKATYIAGPFLLLPAAWAAGGLDMMLTFSRHEYLAGEFAASVARSVVPSLSPDQRRDMLRDLLALPEPTTGALLLAQRMGATDDAIRAALPRLVRGQHGVAAELLRLLYVHDDPETIVREAVRVGAAPRNESEARDWLAATGLHGVPLLGDVATASYQGERNGLVRALGCVEAPSVAPIMLALRKTTAKEAARQWLESNIAHAIVGLLPLVGTKDKLARAATDHLRDLCRRGYGWLVEQKAGGRADVAKQVLDPRAGLTKPNAADLALATRLAPIPIKTPSGPRAIGPDRTATVLAEMRSSSLGAPTPRLALFREHVDEHARDAFAWAVFQSWLQDGANTKERYKMEAVGQLGGDASAIALAKLVRVWPGESQHQRAVLGLECLRAIGTDTALMQIHGIAQKVSFKGIKERANECMEGIAQDRGMSRDELADRIIPDGGLDERGSRVFDFGPRRFEFVLGDDLKPMVRDESGKRLPNLPKPNSKDDAELANEATAAWKLLKKQVAEVVKTQVVRLEQAMVVGRRWSTADFEALFVKHPLMVHLVRRVIWGAYATDGAFVSSFRVADDGTLASATDDTYAYPDDAVSVGVVHPSHLGADDGPAWGELLADYEVVPPFPQLGRPTYDLSDEERTGTMVKRFEKDKLVARVLVFGLEAMGWVRGRPQDGGGFCSHHKTFGSVTAVVTYQEGCWVGTNGEDWPLQTINGLGFIADAAQAEDGFFGWGFNAHPLTLGDIDPVIVSEVLHDLTRLVEKGKEP